jgi:hypothetical protein
MVRIITFYMLQMVSPRVTILMVRELFESNKKGKLKRLPVRSRRKVRMTSSQHAPYVLGDTRATMVGTMRCNPAKAS